MNYRHIYHAGNFADVIKHIVLLALINSLKHKEKPFCVLDTHAGIGLYPLQSRETQKTQEYQNGVARLFFNSDKSIPILVAKYLKIIQQFNRGNELNFYPGSPLITLALLREHDRLIACELHKEDVSILKQHTNEYESVAIHHMNGYHAMKAFLPPAESRGLVLIDPPFENESEFEDIIEHLKLALKHWRGGIYTIWYPIKDKRMVNRFYSELKSLSHPQLIIEFTLKNLEKETGLNSCGLVIINPPWKIQELLSDELLPYLATKLDAKYSIQHENL